jgi:hypothetical protein
MVSPDQSRPRRVGGWNRTCRTEPLRANTGYPMPPLEDAGRTTFQPRWSSPPRVVRWAWGEALDRVNGLVDKAVATVERTETKADEREGQGGIREARHSLELTGRMTVELRENNRERTTETVRLIRLWVLLSNLRRHSQRLNSAEGQRAKTFALPSRLKGMSSNRTIL